MTNEVCAVSEHPKTKTTGPVLLVNSLLVDVSSLESSENRVMLNIRMKPEWVGPLDQPGPDQLEW